MPKISQENHLQNKEKKKNKNQQQRQQNKLKTNLNNFSNLKQSNKNIFATNEMKCIRDLQLDKIVW